MKLAIHGGKKLRSKPFPRHKTIGLEEKKAVERVMESGVLSKYLGCWHENFMGGPEVQALETEWADFFGVNHAIAVNSCTSGLFCAVGAMGTEPGDEIIVTPYTMSATAMAPLIYNAIPVFADIEADYFCLDPLDIEARITPHTKGILVVDLFGHAYDADAINAIARKHDLWIIEDTAQAPGGTYKDRFTGTLGDVGVFSLNYHKHIHCGEGGIVVTNDNTIADRIRLIRNHGESVVEEMGVSNIVNLIGFNFRMTEMEAAVARCQLKKIPGLIEKRIENQKYIADRLAAIPAITAPVTRAGCKHVYYMDACKFDEGVAGVSRNHFIEAVQAELPVFEGREAEGVRINYGYVKPIYLQPIFQEKTAYGSNHFPFNNPERADLTYNKGACPVCERMFEKELFTHEMMLPSMTKDDMDDVIQAFYKVWENREALNEI